MTRAADVATDLLADPPQLPGVSLTDALGELVTRIERGKPIIDTLRTGVGILDESTGGLVRGEFLGIVAAPGVGKSLLADRLTLGVLREQDDATGIIFNLETSTLVRVARLVCGAAVRIGTSNQISACVPLGPLLRGELEKEGRMLAVTTAGSMVDVLSNRLRFVDDLYDARDIANAIRSASPSIAVVDHFGLVTFSDLTGGGGSVERFDAALHEICDAVRGVNAAGIFVAELTAQALRAGAADIGAVRGSARFASLAGGLLTIVREDAEGSADPILHLELHKSRHGRGMMEQTATLFGGLGYLHFGQVSPLALKRRREK